MKAGFWYLRSLDASQAYVLFDQKERFSINSNSSTAAPHLKTRGQMFTGHSDPNPKDLAEFSSSEVVSVIIGSFYVFLSMRSFLSMAWSSCCCLGPTDTVLNCTQWTFFSMSQYLHPFPEPDSAAPKSYLLLQGTLHNALWDTTVLVLWFAMLCFGSRV